MAAMFMGQSSAAQSNPQSNQSPAAGSGVTLDRVVAVVNRQAILESDLEDEMQLSVLDPSTNVQEKMTERQALEQLISRALIRQQIEQDYLQATEPKPEEIASRLQEIRTCCRHASARIASRMPDGKHSWRNTI